jgi:phosphate transport system permease protein
VKRFLDRVLERLVFVAGLAAVVFVFLIFTFLFRETVLFFREYRAVDFLFGRFWYPTASPPRFGIVSLVLGSLLVTVGAAAIAVPLGVMAALYIAKVAPPSVRNVLKSGVEILAAIPSVVLGFVGMATLVPLVRVVFDLPTGLSAFSGSLILAFMAMPTIVSISEDAITAVPREYESGALALGATRWQTMARITLRAAAPGILAAVMLGVGRVIGETMAVMMITGNAAAIPESIFDPVRTMTATIAAEMGETVKNGAHYRALFAVGLVLFAISFTVNFAADAFLHRRRR